MAGRYKAYPEYKDSGVEWVGKIPSHWGLKKLKYLAPLISEKAKGKTNPIALEHIQSWTGKLISTDSKFDGDGTKFKAGDILFGKLRPYLAKVYLTEEDGEAIGDFHVMRPINSSYGKFLKSLMLTTDYISTVDASTYGAKMPRASWDFTSNIQLPFCSETEAEKIANFLDHESAKIDTLIAKQEKLIELLKEKRQAVISHAVTKGLNPDAPMKDSGVEWLGKVPEHWVVAQLKFNTKLMQTGPFGSQLHAEDYVEGGVPLINPAHMINGEIVPDPQVSVDADTQDRLSRHKLAEGDIIFARRGELGRCAVVTGQQVGWICGTGSLKATLNERLIPEYAYLLITSDGVVAELSLESKGSTMDNLNTETLGKIRTPVPPVHEQRAILAYVDEVSGKYKHLVDLAENAIGLMKERKTALISAAVTGKIDVRHFVVEQGQPHGVQG